MAPLNESRTIWGTCEGCSWPGMAVPSAEQKQSGSWHLLSQVGNESWASWSTSSWRTSSSSLTGPQVSEELLKVQNLSFESK